MLPNVSERYQLQDLLYESVNSCIYKAIDNISESLVVLKCFSRNQQEAFLREMSAAFGIVHPNINRCLDTLYLEEDKRPCIVYEFIAGGSLRQYLQSHQQMSEPELFACLKDLLTAIQHIHDKGFIHCDLKPENILLKKQHKKTHYILSDLGAAASIKEAHAGTHTMSSPAYAAPERVYERFNTSSDLYSIGVIAYELSTGTRPFSGSTTEIARAHLSKEADFLLIKNPHLREFIAQLMNKNPLKRIDSQHALSSLKQIETGAFYQEAETTIKTKIDKKPVSQLAIGTVPLINIGQMRKRYQTVLGYQPTRILSFLQNNALLLGLETDNNFAIIAENSEQPLYLFANVNSVKSYSNDTLAYSLRNGIYWLDLKQKINGQLISMNMPLTAFDINGDYVIWSTEKSRHWVYLPEQTERSYACRNYAMKPVLSLLEDGYFLSSEGYMNHNLMLRDTQFELLKEWQLDGPIIFCQPVLSYFLVMSMDMGNKGAYKIWRLDHKHTEYIELPDTVTHYSQSLHWFFWVLNNEELYGCGVGLKPRFLGYFSLEKIDLFEVSSDHHFVTVAQYQDKTSTIVQIWETP